MGISHVEERTNEQTNERTNKQTDEGTNKQTNERTNKRTKPTYLFSSVVAVLSSLPLPSPYRRTGQANEQSQNTYSPQSLLSCHRCRCRHLCLRQAIQVNFRRAIHRATQAKLRRAFQRTPQTTRRLLRGELKLPLLAKEERIMVQTRRMTGLTADDTTLITSPGTQVAKRKAKAAVIITAARDFINRCNNQINEIGCAYSLLPGVTC